MERFKSFIKTALLGGVTVLLPVAILLIVFRWVFRLLQSAIHPLTAVLIDWREMRELVAFVLVVAIILVACFLIGLLVRTQVGKFLHEQLEGRILSVAPGYALVKETVRHLLGRAESPFASVAFVQLFDSDTMSLAFVTERHENGWYAVFVPTAPNPTSGLVYHVKPEHVHHIKHSVEDVMRTIISCGAGSAVLMAKLEETRRAVADGPPAAREAPGQPLPVPRDGSDGEEPGAPPA